MGRWKDCQNVFTDGAVAAAPYRAGAASQGRIERLLGDLGWSVDERDGEIIGLHFNGRDGVVRKVRIAGGDGSVVTFSADSFAVIPATNLNSELLAYLLARNLGDGGVGQWGMYVADNKNATFHLTYLALGHGLTAQTLKWVCESLCEEAADFDGRVRQLR